MRDLNFFNSCDTNRPGELFRYRTILSEFHRLPIGHFESFSIAHSNDFYYKRIRSDLRQCQRNDLCRPSTIRSIAIMWWEERIPQISVVVRFVFQFLWNATRPNVHHSINRNTAFGLRNLWMYSKMRSTTHYYLPTADIKLFLASLWVNTHRPQVIHWHWCRVGRHFRIRKVEFSVVLNFNNLNECKNARPCAFL